MKDKPFTIEELKEFPSIPASETTRLRVRLVRLEAEKEPRVDVRKWVDGRKYTGFTSAGVMLTLDQYQALKGLLPQIDAALANGHSNGKPKKAGK